MATVKWNADKKRKKGAYYYTVANAITLWRLQDSLLQSYRGIFLTTSSILISTSSLIFTLKGIVGGEIISSFDAVNFYGFSAFLAAVGLCLCFIWHRVTHQKTQAVFFFQFLLYELEGGKNISNVQETYRKFSRCSEKERKKFLKPFREICYTDMDKTSSRHIMEWLPFVAGLVFAVLIGLNGYFLISGNY